MNLLTASIVHFALRSVIVNRLQKSCNFFRTDLLPKNYSTDQGSKPIQLSHSRPLHFNAIPLNRIKSGNQIKYVSALALKLSQFCQQHAAELADQILSQWVQLYEFDPLDLCNPPNGQFLQQVIVTTAPPGWIYFDLTEIGVAEWLQNLLEVSMIDITSSNPTGLSMNQGLKSGIGQQDPQIFEIVYAHHRCCSLLRLARQEGFWAWNSAVDSGEKQDFILPWLVGDRLRCQHRAEWALMTQISDALDHLAQIKHLDEADVAAVDRPLAFPLTLKIARSLSHTFHTFHAACRIWGEVKLQETDRMRVRLGLVQITQHLLQQFLQNLGCDELRAL